MANSYHKVLVSKPLKRKYDRGRAKYGYILEASPHIDPDNIVLEGI